MVIVNEPQLVRRAHHKRRWVLREVGLGRRRTATHADRKTNAKIGRHRCEHPLHEPLHVVLKLVQDAGVADSRLSRMNERLEIALRSTSNQRPRNLAIGRRGVKRTHWMAHESPVVLFLIDMASQSGTDEKFVPLVTRMSTCCTQSFFTFTFFTARQTRERSELGRESECCWPEECTDPRRSATQTPLRR